jgi:hypothetical protein
VRSARAKNVKSWADAWAGIFFMVLGAGGCLFSVYNYRLGTPANMGPGFFPAVVGAVVCLLGIAIFLLALGEPEKTRAANPDEAGAGRVFATLGAIFASVIAFALLLRPFGLVVSIFVMVFISRLVRWGSWLELLVLGAVLTVIAYFIFVVGLEMPLRMVPW